MLSRLCKSSIKVNGIDYSASMFSHEITYAMAKLVKVLPIFGHVMINTTQVTAQTTVQCFLILSYNGSLSTL